MTTENEKDRRGDNSLERSIFNPPPQRPKESPTPSPAPPAKKQTSSR